VSGYNPKTLVEELEAEVLQCLVEAKFILPEHFTVYLEDEGVKFLASHMENISTREHLPPETKFFSLRLASRTITFVADSLATRYSPTH